MGCRDSHFFHLVENVKGRKIIRLAGSASTLLEACLVGWIGVEPGASRLQWKVWSGRQSWGKWAKSLAVGVVDFTLWVGDFPGIMQGGMYSLQRTRPEVEARLVLETHVSSRQGQGLDPSWSLISQQKSSYHSLPSSGPEYPRFHSNIAKETSWSRYFWLTTNFCYSHYLLKKGHILLKLKYNWHTVKSKFHGLPW